METETQNASAGLKAESQLVTFLLKDEEFGFDIMSVREIIRMPKIARVPRTPPYVDGIANLRGVVLPIIDLGTRFGMERAADTDRTRVLVVDNDGVKSGLRVERVRQVTRISQGDIEAPPPAIRCATADYLEGVVKRDNGRRIIMALNARRLCRIGISRGDEEAAPAHEDGSRNEVASAEGPVAARQRDHSGGQRGELQLVTFFLGAEEFGVPISQIREIDRLSKITRVPRADSFAEGVITLRGEVIPILDMRRRLDMAARVADDRTRVIIVEPGGVKTGLIVDSVREVLNLSKRDLAPRPHAIHAGIDQRFISGIGKIEGGERMIVLLNLEKIFPRDGKTAGE